MSHPASKLEGQQFGKLIAISATKERNHNKTIMWLCRCLVCGTEVTVPSTKLKEGAIKSCGCQENIKEARTPKGHSGFNKLFSTYRYAAKARSLSFELTAEEFKSIVISKCTYCGVEPSRVTYGSRGSKKEHGKFISNGVDRVDNTQGYTIANCVPACSICNIAKSDLTQEEFLNWLERIRNFSNS